MRIGVIGSGRIGGTAARLFEAAGHEVRVANSRGEPYSVPEAASFGDVVLVAIPLHAYDSLPPAAFERKIVIDANNYYPGRDGQIPALDSGELTSSELLARHLPGADVVKAFNTMYYETLACEGGREPPLVLFVAGDDVDAKATAAALIRELGFEPLDTGSLREGGAKQQPGTPIYNQPMTAPEAKLHLTGR